jgi:2,3,4,5-tetrahydropyridine-2,6-dicarboxylate N-succinyltransferase
MTLHEDLEQLIAADKSVFTDADRALFDDFKAALNSGKARSAERDGAGVWRVNAWVKQAILLGFRMGAMVNQSPADNSLSFWDKDTYRVQQFRVESGVRIVPGGSAIREGAYLAPGVVCMPPMYVNVGAYVGAGTMIDSHALVGSCAQIGERVHLSAAAQIGGVLEPIGAMPVIIEDDVMIGGNCGVYEGALVREGAVLATGVILNGSTPVYDLVRGEIYRKTMDKPLEIPAGAVVVPGSRPATQQHGKDWGISLYTPVIVKYRDAKTAAATALEDALR